MSCCHTAIDCRQYIALNRSDASEGDEASRRMIMGCFSRIKTRDSDTEISNKCGDAENWTWISNETSRTLVLRDKYRQRFGRLRHCVAPHSVTKVAVDTIGTDTYYQMGILVRDDDAAAAGDEGRTDICVDTDDLMVCSRIIVSSSCDGDKLSVKKIRREQYC